VRFWRLCQHVWRSHWSGPVFGLAFIRSETRNQDGEIVQTLVAKIVLPRRAPDS
jgi:hypothetical protein